MMGKKWFKINNQDNYYTKLLVILTMAFFLPSLLNHWLLKLTISFLFFNLNIFILDNLSISKLSLKTLKIVAVFVFIVDVIVLTKIYSYGDYMTVFTSLLQITFIGVAIIVISHKIFQEKKVTGEVLRGSICVYIMIGFLWATIYKIIYIIEPQTFNNIDPERFIQQLGYFSFVTLTTVGYGDISPEYPLVMSLANLEAIVGQLFPAIMIARLVGLYQAEK
jgi:Ion channel